MSGSPDVRPGGAPRPVETPWAVVGVLATLVLGVAALAVVWNAREADATWRDAGTTISAVADLKLAQLQQWRAERLADAQMIREGPNTVSGLEAVVAGGRAAATVAHVRDWMRSLARRKGYVRVLLLDRAARLVTSSDEDAHPLDSATQRAAVEAMVAGESQLGDIHRGGAEGAVRLDVVAPLPSGRAGNVSFGAVVLEVDPRVALFPRIESYPIPSRSGEVLLLSLEAGAFTFLSDTRARPGSSLRLRRGVSEFRPEVMEAMARGGGLVVQEDYRGVPVLAATRRVPGSTWVLTAKVDVAEIRGPIRQRAWLLGWAVGLFTLGCAAAVLALWRQRSARHYRQLYEGEMERRALAQHYEYLTRYANDIILLADEQGRIVEANDRAISEYGYTREELLGLTVADLRAPENPLDLGALMRDLRESGGLVYELAHRRKDGSAFPVEASTRLVEIEGRPYLQGVIRDIGERRRHERRIADLNRLYAVLSRINEAIVRARDRDLLLAEACRVSVEAGALRLAWIAMLDGEELKPAAMAGGHEEYVTGLRLTVRDEPRGQGPTGQAVREDRVAVCGDIAADPTMAAWRDAALSRGLRSFAALPLRMHGRPVGALCLYAGEPQFFDAEQLALLGEVAADLSYALEVLEQEERRRQSEVERTRLVTAIEQSSEAVMITDVTGDLQYVNAAFERMSGYSKAEARGRNPRFLKSGQHDAEFYGELWGTLRRGDTWRGRITNRRKDGATYEQESTISPIRDATGTVVSFVAVARDVTRERALEDQLRQSQKMEELGQLAGGLAHDFNNLLTAIIGSAELALADLEPGAAVATDVENVRRAARRGAELTHKLLAFSRRQRLVVGPVQLGKVVADFALMVRRVVREDVDLEVHIDPEVPVIAADPGAIEQVLMNLVTNARDAIAGRGTITIEVARGELTQDDCDLLRGGVPGACAVLTVSDTGAGMSEEVQRRLIEPFFTTKEAGAGTGLGMSIVYGLVQEHRGFLQVDSTEGHGTTIRVYLPERPADKVEGAAAPSGPGGLPHGTETVLVVEDEEDLRAFARRALERHGYTVVAASDGVEALAILRERGDGIALVLSDMVMPRMGGLQLEREMREAGMTVPVLFTSGYPAMSADDRRLRASGGPFLPKPWTVGDLLRKVREALDAGTV